MKTPQKLESPVLIIRQQRASIAALTILVLFFFIPRFSIAQDDSSEAKSGEKPTLDLIDGDPFDRIYLDDFNKSETLDIKPSLNPPRKPYPQQEFLIFELSDYTGYLLQVPFQNVVNYKTFDELVMDEAEKYLAEKNYRKAFRNIVYLYDKSGENESLARKLKEVLYLDAAYNYNNGEFGMALSMFEDLYSRDPRFEIPGVEKKAIDLIIECYERLLTQVFDKQGWGEIRGLLGSIEEKYAVNAQALVSRWRARLDEENRRLRDEARAKLEERDFVQARLIAGRALQVLPEDSESRELLSEILDAFPVIFVGVSQPAVNPDPQRIDDWASRRIGRLTRRSLMELTGYSDEGGRYKFPNGSFSQMDELGMVYRFVLDDGPVDERDFGVPELTAHELAMLLIVNGKPGVPGHHVPWARIVDTISVLDSRTVEVRLKAPFVRPEALLQLPYTMPGSPPRDDGPYRLVERNDERTIFKVNEELYPRRAGEQYPDLVEWTYKTPGEAVDALIRGDVDVVDRISNADYTRLKENPDIEVRSYVVPTMHMLIPNPVNDFTKQSMFRMGLLRAIERERILNDMIMRGQVIDGTEFVDSPFPIGMADNDQIAYAIDPGIVPSASNYLLGKLLVNAEQNSQQERYKKKNGEFKEIPIPTLTLAHPASDVARIACMNIASSWRQIGVACELVEIPQGKRVPDGKYDFLYVELVVSEPLGDADKLFGTRGLVTDLNATIEKIVRDVNTASSWRNVSSSLRVLHRQSVNSMTVLPLFQIREHYAYRKNVSGVGRNLIFLYQNVEQWRVEQREEALR